VKKAPVSYDSLKEKINIRRQGMEAKEGANGKENTVRMKGKLYRGKDPQIAAANCRADGEVP